LQSVQRTPADRFLQKAQHYGHNDFALQGARAEELMLCKYFTEMGRCPLMDCKFAHGEEDLAQRKYEFECAPLAIWPASMAPPNPSWLACHCPLASSAPLAQ